ncbi:hypothetical protein HJD18_10035 [Thermoleophilia bacterium SCSIO 60948]|nr:hypothetical protein HJD18_10035 [Thermoleophilia bacterium SCSIO 60948]
MTTPTGGEATKAGVGLRFLALLGALVLAFGAAVLIYATVTLVDSQTCEQAFSDPTATECYLGSSFEKTIGTILTGAAGLFGAAAALLALGFALGAATGRKLAITTIIAVVLAAIAIIFF